MEKLEEDTARSLSNTLSHLVSVTYKTTWVKAFGILARTVEGMSLKVSFFSNLNFSYIPDSFYVTN